jgi:outer membrane protein TolC
MPLNRNNLHAVTAILCSLALCSSAQTFAQTNSPAVRNLSLNEAIRTALANNRLLQIERMNPEIARMTLRSSYGYYDPIILSQVDRESSTDSGAFDPAAPGAADAPFSAESEVARNSLTGFLPSGLSYILNADFAHSTGTRDFLNFESYRLVANASVRQPLLRNLWIDLPRYTIRLNKSNLRISEHGVRFVTMDTINQVRQSYYDLVLAWENVGIQRDLLDARETFLRGVRRQIEVGIFTVLEEKLAQSQHASVIRTLIAASNAVTLAGNNLKTLLGLGATNWTEALFLPTDSALLVAQNFDLPASWQRGLTYRPDLAQVVQGVESADLNVRFRRNQLFPSLDLIGGYGRRGADALQTFPPDPTGGASLSRAFGQIRRGDAPSELVGVVLTFPLSLTAERANYRASKHLKEQALLLARQKEELIMREVSDAIQNARFSFEQAHAARAATDYAREALQAEEQKLVGGKSSIFFVLQLQTDLTTSRLAEAQARTAYNKAISQLHFAEGSILDANRINIEIR